MLEGGEELCILVAKVLLLFILWWITKQFEHFPAHNCFLQLRHPFEKIVDEKQRENLSW